MKAYRFEVGQEYAILIGFGLLVLALSILWFVPGLRRKVEKGRSERDVPPEYPYRSKLEVWLLLSAPNGARRSHETVEIYRRADHVCAATGR